MNLRELSKLAPRKRLKPGDIFVFQVRDGEYGFGRVVKTNVAMMGGRLPLVYLYRATSPEPTKIPALSVSELLAPPIITSAAMWKLGYFENVAHRPIEDHDMLEKHCFYWSPMRKCVDLEERETTCSEPCGDYAVILAFDIDNIVSDAFGVPRAHHPDLPMWTNKKKPKSRPKPES